MLFVPVLDEVAARMAGEPVAARSDPQRWAYRLRDAVSLARPDWVVTHHDLTAEADAIRTAGGDPLELPLAECEPVAALVELAGVLVRLYPSSVVAASVTGPVALCAALDGERGAELDAGLLADCGDALAELVAAYVVAGARRVLVWEPPAARIGIEEVRDAHAPVLRRLATLGAPALLCDGIGLPTGDYPLHARADRAANALLVDPGAFARSGMSFGELWRSWSAVSSAAGPPQIAVTNGPVPRSADLTLLRAAGERAHVSR